MDLLFTLLTILGAVIIALSSVYSLTFKLYKEDDSGKRTILPAGKKSILFTALGLTITLISNYLNLQIKHQQQFTAALAEAKQAAKDQRDSISSILRENQLKDSITFQSWRAADSIRYTITKAELAEQYRLSEATERIIIAGSPLQSLEVDLEFNHRFKYFEKIIYELGKKAWDIQAQMQGEISDEQGRANQIYNGFVPTFNASIYGKKRAENENENFQLCVSLNDEGSSFLSFGYDNETYGSPPNLITQDGLRSAIYRGTLDKSYNIPQFYSDGKTVGLYWNLDSYTFNNSVHLGENMKLTAQLPSSVIVTILYYGKNLFTVSDGDFDKLNNGLSDDSLVDDVYEGSALYLTPNLLANHKTHYYLDKTYQTRVVDTQYGDDERCRAIVLVYKRIKKFD